MTLFFFVKCQINLYLYSIKFVSFRHRSETFKHGFLYVTLATFTFSYHLAPTFILLFLYELTNIVTKYYLSISKKKKKINYLGSSLYV